MAYNKVIYNNTTLIDLTSDTVTADKLMQGYTAHDKSGTLITGTATGGVDGNNLEYGITDGTIPKAGIAQAGYAHLWDENWTMMQIGNEIGTARVV